MRSRTSTSAPEETKPVEQPPAKEPPTVAEGARPSRRRSQGVTKEMVEEVKKNLEETRDLSEEELEKRQREALRDANKIYGKFGAPEDALADREDSRESQPLDAEVKSSIEALKVGAGFDAIIDNLFVFDTHESYQRIQGFLVSSKKASRQDYGSLLDALDEAAEVSRIALQMVANAVVARENFESEADVIAATLRESATQDLRRTGDKITNDAIEARMSTLHHDEVRSLAERRAKAKQTVVYLEGLAKVAAERQRDLRQMVATSAKS